MSEETCFRHAIVPTVMGMPVRAKTPCTLCGDIVLPPTGAFRTHQLVVEIAVYADGIEFDYGVLCAGCCTLPFMFTVPVVPTQGFDAVDELMIEGWRKGRDACDISGALNVLHARRVSVEVVRACLPTEHMCLYCFRRNAAVDWCPRCRCVPLCARRARCPGLSLHRFACDKIASFGGAFDLRNVRTWE